MGNNNKLSLSKKNQKALESYLMDFKANGRGDKLTTFKSHKHTIRGVLARLNVDYDKITKDDLTRVFSEYNKETTRENAKVKMRCFIRYHFGDQSNLYKSIKINSSVFTRSTKTFDDILRKDDIDKILTSNISLRYKAIFELILVSGLRRDEARHLRIKNVEIKSDEITVHVTVSKTGPRNIHLVAYPDNTVAFYPSNFVTYYQSLKNNDPESFLFYSAKNGNYGNQISISSLNQIMNVIRKRAGVTQKITPHILRHTCASYDGYHLTEAQLCLKFGWAEGSRTVKQYVHLNDELMAEHLKRKAGLTKEIVKSESQCPYCHAINNINAEICVNCKRIISKKLLAQEHQRSEEIITNLKNKYEKDISDLKKEVKLMEFILDKLNVIEYDGNEYKLTSQGNEWVSRAMDEWSLGLHKVLNNKKESIKK
jgi:integrase